ncbi:zinc finger, CCHC-type containing protein [Tanacetum coccineum]
MDLQKKTEDLTKEFLSLRFSIKDMGEADVILGIRIKYESNGIAISQSYYIEKVLKKFNYFDSTLVSTPMDTSEKLMPNNVGKLNRYTSNPVLEGYTDASKKQTCISGSTMKSKFVALAADAPISIRYDSAATLAKAYSQMYNGKSRHLGVRHNMICELITNEVVSIEFVRYSNGLKGSILRTP